MKRKDKYIIQWKSIDRATFMYGTQLVFNERETFVSNHLIPPGAIIHTWRMLTDFIVDKVSPTLPILKRQHTYVIYFDYEVVPARSIYFELLFYRKNRTLIDKTIIMGVSERFIFPEDAFYYEINMLNASMNQLKFRKISILVLEEDEVVK